MFQPNQFKPAALVRVTTDRKTKHEQIDYNKPNTFVVLEKAAVSNFLQQLGDLTANVRIVQFTIGREHGSDILLRSEHKVSRMHAWIHWTNSKWWIVDKKSRNGTMLNGFKIPPDNRVQLTTGARISFHDTGYSFIFLEDYLSAVIGQSPNSLLHDLSHQYKTLQNQMILEQIRYADVKSRSAKGNNSFLSELICAICSEYFVAPQALNCSHTFCEWCITNWTKEDTRKNINPKCPMCREPIRTVTKVLFAETMVPQVLAQTLTAEELDEWNRLCRDRKAELETVPSSTSNNNQNHHNHRRGSRPQAVVFPVRQVVQNVDPFNVTFEVGHSNAPRNRYEHDDGAETEIASSGDEDDEPNNNRSLRSVVTSTNDQGRKRTLPDQTGHRPHTRSQSERRRPEQRDRSSRNRVSRRVTPVVTPTPPVNHSDLIPESWFQTPRPGQSRTSALREHFETLSYAPAPRHSIRSRHQSGRW